jgi:hypothetical protein
MTRRSTAGFRQAAALVLLGGLLLVIGAPLWHHDHHPATPAVHHDHDDGSDLHVCRTGSHASGPFDQCPICLSQRLLTQASTEQPVELSAPSADSELDWAEVTFAGFAVDHSTRARAPPLR